jgi:hypothetical protein
MAGDEREQDKPEALCVGVHASADSAEKHGGTTPASRNALRRAGTGPARGAP